MSALVTRSKSIGYSVLNGQRDNWYTINVEANYTEINGRMPHLPSDETCELNQVGIKLRLNHLWCGQNVMWSLISSYHQRHTKWCFIDFMASLCVALAAFLQRRKKNWLLVLIIQYHGRWWPGGITLVYMFQERNFVYNCCDCRMDHGRIIRNFRSLALGSSHLNKHYFDAYYY